MYRSAGSKTDGTPFVMLGLTDENIRLLQELDRPIKVNLRNLDPDGPPVIQLPDLEVVIYFASEKNLKMAEDMALGDSVPQTVLGRIKKRQQEEERKKGR